MREDSCSLAAEQQPGQSVAAVRGHENQVALFFLAVSTIASQGVALSRKRPLYFTPAACASFSITARKRAAVFFERLSHCARDIRSGGKYSPLCLGQARLRYSAGEPLQRF